MTCTNTSLAGTATGRHQSGLVGRSTGLVSRWWRTYWDWRARKATVFILRSLDRRTLHDIGIDPSEIESLVYGRGSDRCRRYDALWPWRSGRA